MELRLYYGISLVSLLFREVEYDRPSLNPLYFLEKIFIFLLVFMYNVTHSCVLSACVIASCGGHIHCHFMCSIL